MGIHKRAKNINIKVKGEYYLKAGKLIKTADKINIEAKKGNLNLYSGKKIVAEGNKNNEE